MNTKKNYNDFASDTAYWNHIDQLVNDTMDAEQFEDLYQDGYHFACVWVDESGYYDHLSDEMKNDLHTKLSQAFDG